MYKPIHLVPANTKIDFIRYHKPALLLSVIMVVGSVILLFTAKDAPPLVGSYRDRFALTPEGWRFIERRGALTFA